MVRSYEEAIEKVFDLLDECDEKGLSEDADSILLAHLDDVNQVKNLTKKQMQTIQVIYDELTHLLNN